VIVFACLAITSILSKERFLTSEKIRCAARDVRVFGDDIILRTEHFQDFADWINSFGLKINQGKTFSTGNFRESCGVDAFRGVDITPVYLRYDPDLASADASAFVSLVSSSNQLWMRGYYETSNCLKEICEQVRHLPLVPKNSSGLGWHTRLDQASSQRWNENLHRFEVRTYVPYNSRRKDELDGYPALIKYFHQPLIGRDDPTHLSDSVRRFDVKLRKRWVQV